MLRGNLLRSAALGCLVVAMSGCQTMNAVERRLAGGHTYETVEAKLMDEAPKRRVPELTESLGTVLLDRVNLSEDGEPIGFNVAERLRSRDAAVQRGLSPVDLRRAELRRENVAELDGKGSEAIRAYILSIVERLAAHWPHEPLSPPLTVVVLDDDDYNASMDHLNVMSIHLGALLNCQSEDELAGLIAHEMTHAYLRHHNSQDWKAVEQKTLAVGAAFVASRMGGNASAARTGIDSASKVVIAEAAFRRFGNAVLYPSWDRHQEDESDLMAVDLLYRAGYDWTAVETFLERLADAEAKRKTAEDERLADFAREQEAATRDGSLGEAMQASIASITHKVASLTSELSSSHAPADARIENVLLYLEREYDGSWPPSRDDGRFQDAIFKGEGFQAIRKRVYLRDAEKMLGEGRFREAREAALKSLDHPDDPEPQARIVLYRSSKAQKMTDEALRHLELAARSPKPTLVTFDLLVEEYSERQRWKDALATWSARSRQFRLGAREVVPPMIGLLVKAGEHRQARRMLDDCQAEKDLRLKRMCKDAYDHAAAGLGQTSGADPGESRARGRRRLPPG